MTRIADIVRSQWAEAPAAFFADNDRMRLMLTRRWEWSGGARPLLAWMLNPSTAGALDDDPTVRKCMGFALRAGCGGLVVVNWSPVVATDPKDLFLRDDLKLDASAPFIDHAIRSLRPRYVLGAWGANGAKIRERNPAAWDEMLAGVRQHSEIWCLDETKGGDPVHPLYQSYAKTARIWRAQS